MCREQAQMLGKIRRDLIETRGKNIDRMDAASEAAPCPLLHWNFHVSTCWGM